MPPPQTNHSLIIIVSIFIINCVLDYYLRSGNSFIWGIVHWIVLSSGIVLMMILPSMIGEKTINRLSVLGKSSFFIFCLHEPIIPYISQFVLTYCDNGNLGYTFTILLDITICLTVYLFMRMICPGVLTILNGSR